MHANKGRFGPAYPRAGRFVGRLSVPFVRAAAAAMKFYDKHSRYAVHKGGEMRRRLRRGETVYVIGIGPAGHNSAVALVEISRTHGIRAVCNNEEERFTGVNADASFPANALREVFETLRQRDVQPADVLAIVGSWDYMAGISTSLRVAIEEAPVGLLLTRRAASPEMNAWHFVEALTAPYRMKRLLGTDRPMPVIGMRHHDNHACLAFALSPFVRTDRPTMIAVMDGFGDDGSISFYVGRRGKVQLVRAWPGLFDSLGMLYAIISSTQGGWTPLSSEGRYMGASAWGNTNRRTNPYYEPLRQILYLGPDGQVCVNRSMVNYHRRGREKPYGAPLVEILGHPIPTGQMWNPDAVLNVDDIEHAQMTRQRVDKAAALQMVFEDAVVHIVDYLIHHTGSYQLALGGGTALNCVSNMNLLEHFDEAYYRRSHGQHNTRLHLWVPPNPSDPGTAMGAAYNFAMSHGAIPGPGMTHAFICGRAPTVTDIERAVAEATDTECITLGNVYEPGQRQRVAELVAGIIAHDGVLGLFQGRGETGPRALGHRSILANACNPETPTMLNANVKYRETFRPLAPMLTLQEAKRLYHLSDGALDDDYNAYNYMVLTVRARPEALALVPAVIHRNSTSRIQIVRGETDPLSYAILKAIGRRLGVEAAVNTSLNVGTPIVQTPAQAVGALHRARGMTGLVMVADDGTTYLVWHQIDQPPKDAGRRLMQWVHEWSQDGRPLLSPI